MVLSLMLVSREFQNYFQPLLWTHVRIEKPSALFQLHAALSSSPANGAFIKSLHLGPLSGLDEKYWPVRMKDEDEPPFQADEPMVFFKTGLTTVDDGIRPRGIKADKEIAYQESDSRAAKVLREALEVVNVEAMEGSGCSDADQEDIGIVEWTKRIFYAQGALDLYLAKMRELDDAKAATESKRTTYPRLVLEGFTNDSTPEVDDAKKKSTKAKKASNDLIITRDMIHAHWARPGAHTDHFDHPLVFAEPGIRLLARSCWEEVVVNPAKARPEYYFDADTHEDEDASPGDAEASDGPLLPRVAEGEENRSASSNKSSTSNQPSPRPSSSIGPLSRDNILDVGCFIVQHASKVTNLSLSGLFHDLLSSCNFEELRHLSVGPLTPPDAAAALLSSGLKLPNIKKLRVCGDHPALGIAKAIAGEIQGLEGLEEVHWDFGYANVPNAPSESLVFEMLNTMRGAKKPAQQSHEEQKRSQDRKSPVQESKQQLEVPRRYIEVRTHPTYVSALLNMASTDISAAWRNGLQTNDAHHRLRLLESRAWKDVKTGWWDPETQKYNVLRRETRQWWEECALED